MTDDVKSINKKIENCILSLATGDLTQLDALYDMIKTDVYAYALSKVCNKEDAEDILQDTFVRIYENAKLYAPQGKPKAWIFTIEGNIINRYFQLKKRQVIPNNEDVFNNVVSEKENIEERIIQNEYIDTLLKTLNEFEREVISLHIVSNMKFKDISKQLNKPLSTVLSKYNRAIKKLKRMYKEEENEK